MYEIYDKDVNKLLKKYNLEDLQFSFFNGSVLIDVNSETHSFNSLDHLENFLKVVSKKTDKLLKEQEIIFGISEKVSKEFMDDVVKKVNADRLEKDLNYAYDSDIDVFLARLSNKMELTITRSEIVNDGVSYPHKCTLKSLLNALISLEQVAVTKVLQTNDKYVKKYIHAITNHQELSEEVKSVLKDATLTNDLRGVLEINALYKNYFSNPFLNETNLLFNETETENNERTKKKTNRLLSTNFSKSLITLDALKTMVNV
jgi:hypothetical protein